MALSDFWLSGVNEVWRASPVPLAPTVHRLVPLLGFCASSGAAPTVRTKAIWDPSGLKAGAES